MHTESRASTSTIVLTASPSDDGVSRGAPLKMCDPEYPPHSHGPPHFGGALGTPRGQPRRTCTRGRGLTRKRCQRARQARRRDLAANGLSLPKLQSRLRDRAAHEVRKRRKAEVAEAVGKSPQKSGRASKHENEPRMQDRIVVSLSLAHPTHYTTPTSNMTEITNATTGRDYG